MEEKENETLVIPRKEDKKMIVEMTRAEALFWSCVLQLCMKIIPVGLVEMLFQKEMPDADFEAVAESAVRKFSDVEHKNGWCAAKDCNHKK